MVRSPRSSSMMVPVADARNVLSVLSLRVRVNVSVSSGVVSGTVCTKMVFVVAPGSNSSVPELDA